MSRIQFAIAAALLALCSFAAAQDKPDVPKPQPEPKKIHGEGCVEAGVEANCLVVRDVHAGKIYNILVGEPRPTLGEGIEFTGTAFQGVSMCMQGTAIEVERWSHKESIHCRHTPARPKKDQQHQPSH
jgi:hypothetical protein